MDAYHVIQRPLATEKAVKLMEKENKLTFRVHEKATKELIKKSIESLFKVKVKKINTVITPRGKKKAIITLQDGQNAMDVATKLGLI